jgi:hypothetical protein
MQHEKSSSSSSSSSDGEVRSNKLLAGKLAGKQNVSCCYILQLLAGTHRTPAD